MLIVKLKLNLLFMLVASYEPGTMKIATLLKLFNDFQLHVTLEMSVETHSLYLYFILQ